MRRGQSPIGSYRLFSASLRVLRVKRHSLAACRPPAYRCPVTAADPVLDAVAPLARDGGPPLVLAVSGGRDSMVLLEACARAIPGRVAAVATFDHGTGEAATRAARHVAAYAGAHGFVVERGGVTGVTPRTEAAWRAARWRFLEDVAERHRARIVTAHTRDDLVETVAMRTLRGAGARGLAAMLAPGRALRPLLDRSREDVARWAEMHGVRWIDDPSNASRAHLRNRVRMDLLPALRTVRPRIDEELLAVARDAAMVRAALDAAARRLVRAESGGAISIAAADLEGYDGDALRALWPALAACAGATLDRRGTSRAAAFTMRATTGGTIPLASGFQIVRAPDRFLVRRVGASRPRRVSGIGEPGLALADGVECGGFRFAARPARSPAAQPDGVSDDAWSARLPADVPLTVRPWQPGDRMRVSDGGAARRVKRYFGDVGIPGMDRAGWPVVLAAGEIVWIPGVRRSDAATVRSGRPGLRYVCERIRH